MFISFIVPVYNAEMYLEECLDSLLKQDLTYSEYEIICVNDGSTDKSLELLCEYKKRYSNIRVIDKQNSGVSSARNTGLDVARGEYVWFIDADDFISCNILKMLSGHLADAKTEVLQFGTYTLQDELSPTEKKLYESGELKPKSFANNVFVTRSIFKKAFLKQNGITFYTELSYSEDKVFVSEVLSRNPVIEKINDVCYYYRYHAGSAISKGDQVDINKKYSMWIFAINRFKESYANATDVHKSAIADNLMSEVYHCFYTITGLPSDQYSAIKKKLKADGILLIRRPKECTLRRSYLVNHSMISGKIFDFVFIRLDSDIERTMMRCIRLANRIRKKRKVMLFLGCLQKNNTDRYEMCF